MLHLALFLVSFDVRVRQQYTVFSSTSILLGCSSQMFDAVYACRAAVVLDADGWLFGRNSGILPPELKLYICRCVTL